MNNLTDNIKTVAVAGICGVALATLYYKFSPMGREAQKFVNWISSNDDRDTARWAKSCVEQVCIVPRKSSIYQYGIVPAEKVYNSPGLYGIRKTGLSPVSIGAVYPDHRNVFISHIKRDMIPLSSSTIDLDAVHLLHQFWRYLNITVIDNSFITVKYHPAIVSSWYRDKDVNDIVGGVKNSWHLGGAALDFYVQGMTVGLKTARAKEIVRKLEDLKLHWYYESKNNFFHADLRHYY